MMGLEVSAGAERLSGLEGEPAGEDRQSLEQQALGFEQQCIAPVDRCLKRLVARDGGARAAGQQAESVMQPLEDLLW